MVRVTASTGNWGIGLNQHPDWILMGNLGSNMLQDKIYQKDNGDRYTTE